MLSALLLLGAALAAPLAWRWEAGQPQRFHLESTTQTPRGRWFLAAANDEARALEVSLSLDASCRVASERRKAWELRCELERAEVSGTAAPGEEPTLDRIFAEYGRVLQGAELGFVFTRRGRIRSFELVRRGQDAPQRDERSATEDELLTRLLAPLFGLLELELPEGEPGSWKQGGSPLVFSLDSSLGTAGGVRLEHSVEAWEGPVALIHSEGRATLMPGGVAEMNAALLVAVDVVGEARFDAERGMLLSRELVTLGHLSAGSSQAMPDDYLRRTASLERLPPASP